MILKLTSAQHTNVCWSRDKRL